ncbi:MAG: hypothetical protein ACK5Y2_02010 [Bdellovibrionales bacterium]
MLKVVIASALMATISWASSPTGFMTKLGHSVLLSSIEAQNLIEWKQGDTNSYDIGMMGGFVKGTMVQKVRSVDAEGIWVDQDMDVMGQKQQASQLIDPATGEIKKFIVNGKEEKVPEPGEQEILEATESKITVPAGNFECIFVKIKDKKSGDITQAWINPEKVSIGGMLKVIQPSQFGEVTIALKSYKKN